MADGRKELIWVGRSRKDLGAFPPEVRRVMGFAIHLAQLGQKHDQAKPLKGFGGAGVLEVVQDDDGSTFRAVYTVKFEDGVYVLDAFQKKSVRGIKTAAVDIDRIKARLKDAQEIHNERNRSKKKQKEERPR
jgi:phage-related protein